MKVGGDSANSVLLFYEIDGDTIAANIWYR